MKESKPKDGIIAYYPDRAQVPFTPFGVWS